MGGSPVNTWVRIALIVALALILWFLVIDTTEEMTGGPAPAPVAPAPAAPN